MKDILVFKIGKTAQSTYHETQDIYNFAKYINQADSKGASIKNSASKRTLSWKY